MRYFLFLDDERTIEMVFGNTLHKIPAQFKDLRIFLAKNVEDALKIMDTYGAPTYISFDNDLGHQSGEGRDLARILYERDLDAAEEGSCYLPMDFEFNVHSANPIASAAITNLLTPYLEYRQK